MSDLPHQQQELPLPFPELTGDQPLIPASQVAAYQYCPRQAYLQWVQGEWQDTADTVDGRRVHKNIDKPGGVLPVPADEKIETIHAQSITLSSSVLGIIARMDLIEGDGEYATPVEYKRGKRPHVEAGAYDPERVQLCLQSMLLCEQGYQSDSGIIYYAGSRERVEIVFDEPLINLTHSAINGLRLIAVGKQPPAPLQDSPKCPACSLVGICLPDETSFFRGADINPRPLFVARDQALPVYVQAYYGKVAKQGETLVISIKDKKVNTVRLIDVSQLVLSGNIYLTTPALHELMKRNIPITWQSFGGWFMGHTIGTGHKNVELRTAQYKASFDDSICLALARGFVTAKIRNCRTLLRRNWKLKDKPSALMQDLDSDRKRAGRATRLETLLGEEGVAAARYFGAFQNILKKEHDETVAFDFSKRNRRPPKDPVNAMLSYTYALLTRVWTVTLAAVGFDPYRGFYHQPRYGRPALALDMMEPFRPLIADSCVIQVINNGEVRPSDFIYNGGSVALIPAGRKRLIAAFERRMSHEITHPLLGYKLSYRRLIELQARLLARFLCGDFPEYINFTSR